jgi:ubiquinone/menaquinone biosynthesis C-methylase UbiE
MPGGEDPGRIWDALSARYDRQLWLERSAVAAAVALLSPRVDDRCLDAGTGTGEVLRQLQRLASVPRTVIGIDASPGMLARVGTPLPGWSVKRGDVRHLDLPDASFDAASASYLLHLLTVADLTLALAEIHRVLRPGGRLVTVTPAIPARGIARPLAAALDALSRRQPGYRGLRALDPRLALAQAGFTVEQSRWNLRGYPSICVLARRP